AITVDGTRSARVAHTVVRFPRFVVAPFDVDARRRMRLDFGVEATGAALGPAGTKSSPYTMFVRQYDAAGAPVEAELDRIRFMAGPDSRRVVLPVPIEAGTVSVELALYQARDQPERIRLFRRRVVLGRIAYRQEHDRLVPAATVTDPGSWSQE